MTLAHAFQPFVQKRRSGFRQRSRPARLLLLLLRFRMLFRRPLFPWIVFRHVNRTPMLHHNIFGERMFRTRCAPGDGL
ncbi:hypothetical protein CWO90_36035 [Bradyrhizobium sp. Leo121]|nr:hypothetical protein CWO90_36035 [Bradyrhizobium sp. Leo121]